MTSAEACQELQYDGVQFNEVIAPKSELQDAGIVTHCTCVVDQDV